MFWEYSPKFNTQVLWTLPLIGWEQRALLWMKKKRKKWMMVSILHWLQREITCLLTCGRCSLLSENQYDITVSWTTLWGMIKVYWLDLTLIYILDHAVCCDSAASSGRSLHLIISQLRMKHSLLNCPNHVQWSKSSIKKQIIVCWTVWSIFDKQTVHPLKSRLPVKATAKVKKSSLNEWMNENLYIAHKKLPHKALHVHSAWYTQCIHVSSRKLKLPKDMHSYPPTPFQKLNYA